MVLAVATGSSPSQAIIMPREHSGKGEFGLLLLDCVAPWFIREDGIGTKRRKWMNVEN
jgi:hypothetical protein